MKWGRFFSGCLWLTFMIMAIIFKDFPFKICYILACIALIAENWTDAFSKY